MTILIHSQELDTTKINMVVNSQFQNSKMSKKIDGADKNGYRAIN